MSVAILSYFAKMPILLSWNLFLTFFYAMEVLWRVKSKIIDPRTWITVGFFYVVLNLVVLSFQVFLDLTCLLFIGKTFTGLLPDLGSFISNYGLSSAFSVIIFTSLATYPIVFFLKRFENLKLFRKDVLETIIAYNKEYMISRLKRGIILVIVGLILKAVL